MSSLTYVTRNDLPAKVREEVVDLLNEHLAAAVDLAAQTKQAHWNVKGAQFIALHKLFDEIHADVQEFADVLAERVVQLGGIAEGTVQTVVQRTGLTPYPRTIADGPEHARALGAALAKFGGLMRRAIDAAEDFGDRDTADICTEISRGVDKWLWFVEAHVQQKARAVVPEEQLEPVE
jgi:starvation-inducible DNA-binding protein